MRTTNYPKGVSVRNVPDMPNPGAGSQTFYYSNDQAARLLFYHDHAFGITRLNVYAGEAGGYVLRDQTEKDLISAGTIPSGRDPAHHPGQDLAAERRDGGRQRPDVALRGRPHQVRPVVAARRT